MTLQTLQNFFGILGHFLMITGTSAVLLQLRRRPPLFRWIVFCGCFVAMYLPIGGTSVVGYTRGLIGDLSMTTQILLTCSVVAHLFDRKLLSDADRKVVLTVVAIAGLLFYPMTLGLTRIDPYELGYNSLVLILGLALLSVWGWRRRPGAAVLIPIGLIAFQIGVLESNNIWDYLLDPLVTLYSWVWIGMEIARGGWKLLRGSERLAPA